MQRRVTTSLTCVRAFLVQMLRCFASKLWFDSIRLIRRAHHRLQRRHWHRSKCATGNDDSSFRSSRWQSYKRQGAGQRTAGNHRGLTPGASITTIPQSVLNQNNIKIPTVKNAMRVMGVGGEASASVGRVMLQFGEISQLVPVCIQDDTIPGAAIDIPLLGQSFLAAFNYEVNYRNNTITLTRIRPSAVQNKPKRGVASYSRDQNVVPFTFEGNTMYVTVKVNGRECEMIFDTGATNVVFSDKSMGALDRNVPIHSSRSDFRGCWRQT